MDVACGGGIESVIGAYSRGAPLRIIGSEMIGSPDTYWYVPSNSPIKSLADASGKTISYSQNGSSSHTALLSLLDQYHVDAKPVARLVLSAVNVAPVDNLADIKFVLEKVRERTHASGYEPLRRLRRKPAPHGVSVMRAYWKGYLKLPPTGLSMAIVPLRFARFCGWT
jgi:hypothetical protein